MSEKLFYIFSIDLSYNIIKHKVINRPKENSLLVKILEKTIGEFVEGKKNYDLFTFSYDSTGEPIEEKITLNQIEGDILIIRLNEGDLSSSNSLIIEDVMDVNSCCICSLIIKDALICPGCETEIHEHCLKEYEETKKDNEPFKCPKCRREGDFSKWEKTKKTKKDLEKNENIVNHMKTQYLFNCINKIKIEALENAFKEKISNIFMDILRQITEINEIIKKDKFEYIKVALIKKMKGLTKYIYTYSDFRNEINLKYKTKKEGIENIFGNKFVENNKDKMYLIINNVRSNLTNQYNLKEGDNNVRLIIQKDLTNLNSMFLRCDSLDDNNEELQYLDIRNVTDFGQMFPRKSLSKKFKSFKNGKYYAKWEDNNYGNDSLIIISPSHGISDF